MFKTRLKTFGNDFRLFCNFEKFLIFFENFRQLDLPRNTEQKNFFEKSPQNMFKTRLDTFGNHLGLFCNFENFLIFLKVFEDSTLHGTLGIFGKKIFEKITQNMSKTRLDTFGKDFVHFCNFEKFLIFFENFRQLDPPWNNGQKFFSKNRPKTCSKHVWTLLGTVSGIFEILKSF